MISPFIARMIFAVTVMVAALAFAPSAGMAHAGHDHGPAATQATALISLSAVTEIGSPTVVKSAVTTARWIVGPFDFPAGNQSLICAGGCFSAASASCCALSLPCIRASPPRR